MTSAVKVDGERLYRKAHRGESIETPEREVESTEPSSSSGQERATFEIECSSGTYIRTLVETLGTPTASSCGGRQSATCSRDGDARSSAVEALPFLPERLLTRTRRAVGARAARDRSRRRAPVHLRLTYDGSCRGRARGWRHLQPEVVLDEHQGDQLPDASRATGTSRSASSTASTWATRR